MLKPRIEIEYKTDILGLLEYFDDETRGYFSSHLIYGLEVVMSAWDVALLKLETLLNRYMDEGVDKDLVDMELNTVKEEKVDLEMWGCCDWGERGGLIYCRCNDGYDGCDLERGIRISEDLFKKSLKEYSSARGYIEMREKIDEQKD